MSNRECYVVKKKLKFIVIWRQYDLILFSGSLVMACSFGPPCICGRMRRVQVAECLRMINLDHHVDQFHRMDVDGQLLVSLNAHLLKTDFGFTEFEAIKLMKFAVEGWRPLKRAT